MTFDKVKAMKNAERFLAQGKIRAAISEYKRVVEADKNDFSTLNMLGDLHAKASETDEAVNCFMLVAEHYRKQDFSQKAIAIYNKVSRLKPDSLEVSAKLAQLYQMKGSLAEARTHYTTLAEQYSKTGQKAEALSVWKQIANLDPKDADIYLKIADACWQDHLRDEAATAYVEAGTRLNAKKQYESAVTAFSRALEITPDDVKALKGFVETQMNLGYTDEAAKSLESSLARQPHNREIMYLLIDCHISNGNLSEAEREVVKLVENEPSNFPKLLDIVNAYLKTNNIVSATKVLTMASEHMLVGGQAIELGEFIERILTVNSEYVDAIRLLVRFHSWQRDEAGIQTSLERLAEAAKNDNRPEDEVYALTQLVMIVPQNSYFPQRLHELSVAIGEEVDGYVAMPIGETQISETQTEESKGDIPTFESYSGLGDEENGRFAADTTFGEYQPALNSTNGNGENYTDETAVDYAENGFDYTAEFVEEAKPEEISNEEIKELYAESIAENEAETGRILSEYERHTMQTDLEGVTFYIEQGFIDLAEKTIVELEKTFGIQPEIEEVKAKIGDSPKASDEEEIAQVVGETPTEEVENEVVAKQAETESFEEENQVSVDESETPEEVETAVDDSSNEDLAETTETISDTTVTENTDDLPDDSTIEIDDSQSLEELSDEFEATTETSEEITAEEIATEEIATEEIPAEATEVNEAVEAVEEQSVEDAPTEVEEIAKASLEEVKPTPDDEFEVHYQTGVVYKEMGLIEDSIREFQDAVKLVSIDDGTKRYFWCCNLLGHTFMEKGMPSIAIMWYKRCLGAKDLDSEELNGLNYELGNAYEKAGDSQSAVKYFEEIYGLDVDFRDVGKRLESLLTSQ